MRERQILKRHVAQNIEDIAPEMVAVIAGGGHAHEWRNFPLDPFAVIPAHGPPVGPRDLRLRRRCTIRNQVFRRAIGAREPFQVIERAAPDLCADPLGLSHHALAFLRRIAQGCRFGEFPHYPVRHFPPETESEETRRGYFDRTGLTADLALSPHRFNCSR
jgi:hypothetical protein